MKFITSIFIGAIVFSPSIVMAKESQKVSGYVKKDGTYVAPYHATKKDKTETNNYTTKGNTNPYTGKEGTKTPKK